MGFPLSLQSQSQQCLPPPLPSPENCYNANYDPTVVPEAHDPKEPTAVEMANISDMLRPDQKEVVYKLMQEIAKKNLDEKEKNKAYHSLRSNETYNPRNERKRTFPNAFPPNPPQLPPALPPPSQSAPASQRRKHNAETPAPTLANQSPTQSIGYSKSFPQIP